MFKVDKKVLQGIYNNVLKLISKFVELVIEVKKEGLWITINVESFIHVFVPAEVETTGIFKIQKEIFESLFRLRGNTIECSFNKEQNILNVLCGTKAELFVAFKVSPEELEEPEIQSESVLDLSSKAIGTFKSNIDKIKFTSPDSTGAEYAYIENSKKSLALTFATPNIFAKYQFKETLSDSDFEIAIHFEKFKLALSLIESAVEISLNERVLKIKSDNLILVLPTLIDGDFINVVESTKVVMNSTVYIDGQLDLPLKKIQGVLTSVRSIAIDRVPIICTVKDNKFGLKLQNKFGTTKDRTTIENNTIKEPLKVYLPELFIDTCIATCLTVSENAIMRFQEDLKYYVLRAKNNNIRLTLISTLEQNAR